LSSCFPRYQIANSAKAAENAQTAKSAFVPRKVRVVRNGMDLARFSGTPLPDSQEIHIAGIGSLLPLKRWDRLLTAARELDRLNVRYRIRVAGIGPLRDPLQSEADALRGRVEFLGHVEDIPGLLSQSTFLVHTSDTEGCPNAVIEAMACGRAVVATDAGDIPRLVDDGKTGFVVRRGDDSALVQRILELSSNRALCAAMGEAGRLKAQREFGLERLVRETFQAFADAGCRNWS
jgi:glycosyltransferase involved in cell wall biosynthesis